MSMNMRKVKLGLIATLALLAGVLNAAPGEYNNTVKLVWKDDPKNDSLTNPVEEFVIYATDSLEGEPVWTQVLTVTPAQSKDAVLPGWHGVIVNLSGPQHLFFAATARNIAGESGFSNVYLKPAPPFAVTDLTISR
jgi:hypothetical protein